MSDTRHSARRAEVLGAALRSAHDASASAATTDHSLRACLESLRHVPIAAMVAEAPSGRILNRNMRAAGLWRGALDAASVQDLAAQLHGVRGDGQPCQPHDWPLARALERGEAVSDEEFQVRRPDGTTGYLLLSATPLLDGRGRVRAALATFVDVTERRREERRREFVMRLTDALNHADEPMEVIRTAAAALGGHLGATAAGMGRVDRHGHALRLHAEYRNGVVCLAGSRALDDFGDLLSERLRGGHPVVIEDVARAPDVNDAAVELFTTLETRSFMAAPIMSEGRLVFLAFASHVTPRQWMRDDVGVLHDAARRAWTALESVRTQSALRKSEAWLRLALRAGAAAAWEWDLRTDRITWAEEQGSLFGEATSPTTVESFLDWVHPHDRSRVHRAITRVSRMTSPEIGLEYRSGREGAERWIRVQGQILHDERGRPARAVGVMLDVTDRKLAELEREALLERLRHANESKSNFISVMSHEFRTPLTSVIGYAELLTSGAAGPLLDRQVQQLGRIKASAWHLTQVIDEILTFSRLEAGREHLDIVCIDVIPIVRDALAIIEPTAHAAGLSCTAEIPEALVLRMDEAKLRQILVNLLGNAVKFTSRGGIHLSVTVTEGRARIAVTDTGVGIAPEHHERIFERFWQVDQGATRRAGGTGLGLTVSRRLARLLGGDITVVSDVDRGSTFTAVFPTL
jgi:PAS domain S-box-containing protein